MGKQIAAEHLAMTSCSEYHGPDLNGYQGEGTPPLIVAKGYSAENFTRLMRTGITANGKTSTMGLMSEVTRERFPSMTDDEVHDLKAYLDARWTPGAPASCSPDFDAVTVSTLRHIRRCE